MNIPVQLFLDTEFTGLHQQAQLISLALYHSEETYFYAEFSGIDTTSLNDWVQGHVIPKLNYRQQDHFYENRGGITCMKDTAANIAAALQVWLQQFELAEIWADVLAYDWVLFCELFGGALNLPSNLFYAPFDLATALYLKGKIKPAGQYDGDISRYTLAGMDTTRQHHALEDCRAEKACYQKLITNE